VLAPPSPLTRVTRRRAGEKGMVALDAPASFQAGDVSSALCIYVRVFRLVFGIDRAFGIARARSV
jgi:hypothetical protein